jgi:hypothetical protein
MSDILSRVQSSAKNLGVGRRCGREIRRQSGDTVGETRTDHLNGIENNTKERQNNVI